MKYLNKFIAFFISFIMLHCLNAQDTLIVKAGLRIKSENKEKYFSKGFHGEYGREDVVFSNKHKKIEYCYYIDGVRNCISDDYFILNDSTLMVNDSNTLWNFKLNAKNQYLVSKTNANIYTSGIAISLMPLVFISKLYSINLLSKDTLYSTSYYYPRYFNPQGVASIKPYTGYFKGKLFEYNEIDKAPSLLNGDSIPWVKFNEYNSLCLSQPYIKELTLISVIIASDGSIKMIDQAIGNYDLEYCNSKTYFEIINFLISLGKFKPALSKGKPVNVRWFIKMHRNDITNKLHPVFEDTKLNRVKYIKKVKR